MCGSVGRGATDMEGVNPSLSVLMKGASGRELEVLFDMSALGLAV